MSKLEKILLKLRIGLYLVSFLEIILVPLIGFTIFTFLDCVFILPGVIRVIWVTIVTICSIAFIIWDIFRVPRTSELAWRLEKIHPEIQGRLAVVIDHNSSKSDLKYSMELLKKNEQDALSILRNIKLSGIFIKRLYISISVLLIIALFISFYSDRNKFLRFINPKTPYFSLAIDIKPDSAKIGEYSDIYIRPEGISPKWVWLVSGDLKTKVTKENEGSDIFHYRIENLRESIWVFASLSDVKTEEKRIEVLIPPILRDWTFEYTYPSYTKLPPYRQRRGDIYGLAGTSVSFCGESNVNLGSVLLINRDGDSTYISPIGREFEYTITIKTQDTLKVLLKSTSGLIAEKKEVVINLYPDEYPKIDIIYPFQYIDIPRDMEIDIEYRVSDDFGVNSVLLTYIFRGDSSVKEIVDFNPPTIDSIASFFWDFSDVIILPGDTILYFLTVYDNDSFRGPKKTMSPVYSIRFPLLEELYDKLTSESNKVSNSVESILERLDGLQKKIEKIMESEELTSRDKEAIENLLFEHEELENELAEASRKTEELVSMMENTIFLDEETLNKMRKIDELMKELETEEIKKAREELMEALKENPEMLKEAFEKFNITEEELKKRLENTLAFLEKLKNSQKLQEIVNKLDELKLNQDELKKALDEGANPMELASDETLLKEEMENIGQSLEELSNMMGEIGSELSKAAEQSDKIASSMMNVESSMQMGGTPSSSMEEISKDISSLSKNLQSLQNMMMGGFSDEIKKAIRRNQLASILLSNEQEKILNDRIALEFAKREDALYESFSILRENLLNILSLMKFKDMGIVSLLESAMEEAEKASSNSREGDMQGAIQSGRRTMEFINSVTIELFALEDAMKGMAGGMPSLAQFFQNLANLAQSQIGLNQLAQSMFPMKIGEGGFSSELRELARLQSEIARKLRELAKGTEGRVLGDLEGIAGEMESLASDIERSGLSEEILKRQEKLLKYLLTAQKSIYKERESVRRISKPGKEFPDVISPDELRVETKRGVSQRDILEALKRQYPREYESLIRAYFRALSIE